MISSLVVHAGGPRANRHRSNSSSFIFSTVNRRGNASSARAERCTVGDGSEACGEGEMCLAPTGHCDEPSGRGTCVSRSGAISSAGAAAADVPLLGRSTWFSLPTAMRPERRRPRPGTPSSSVSTVLYLLRSAEDEKRPVALPTLRLVFDITQLCLLELTNARN